MTEPLDIRSLGVRAGSKSLLEGFDLQVGERDFVALIGPNGAGKTTLLRAALGLAVPADGSVSLGGHDPRKLRGRERAALAAWLPQQALAAEPITALELVTAARFRFSESHADSRRAAHMALARVGASEFALRPVTQISGGEHQRVALAALIAQEAPLMLLDEPANHLDPGQQIGIYKLIGELWREGHAVLCVTHDLNLLRFATRDPARVRVVGLSQGRKAFETRLDEADLPAQFSQLFRVKLANTGHALLLVPEDSM
jgi:iron complex transport system ATP-binding protein